jgi:hypothetical protein
VTGIIGEHGGRGGRVEGTMMEEPERGLPEKPKVDPRSSHVNITLSNKPDCKRDPHTLPPLFLSRFHQQSTSHHVY